jgi:hypothetical protein
MQARGNSFRMLWNGERGTMELHPIVALGFETCGKGGDGDKRDKRPAKFVVFGNGRWGNWMEAKKAKLTYVDDSRASTWNQS